MDKVGSAAAVRTDKNVQITGVKIRNRRITHLFYITCVIFMTVLVFIGFWPSYFGQLFGDVPARHWIIHLHALVFTGWLLLLLVQVSLVAAGHTKFHRKLGIAGGVYGIFILILGLAAAFVLPLEQIKSSIWTLEEAASFMILPLGDMLIFSGFFGAAIFYRRKSEIHKRLILVASVMLVFPAVARIFGEENVPMLLLFWLFPLIAGLILDGFLHKKVHPVFIIGLAVLLLSIGRIVIMESEAWITFAGTLLGLFL